MRRFPQLCLVALFVALAASLPRPAAADPDVKVITYSVRGKGNLSDLEAFAAAAAATYADPRGWNLGGSLRFERVASGGDFTLWLTADALMSTFGGACDVIWSCRNGRHVVINEDRWLGASDAWNKAGAPLAAYRQMVLNHETGHWLGFGHGHCSGTGRAAPVMQQQSMSLAGCEPNPWPLAGERATLAARRGVTLVQPGSVRPSTTSSSSTTTSTTGPAAATTSTTRSPTVTTATTRPRSAGGPSAAAGRKPVRSGGDCLVHVNRAALAPPTRCLLT